MDNVLTWKNLTNLIGGLKQKSQSFFWIDNEYFYQSEVCKMMFGGNPTAEEIQKAKRNKNGYIKTSRGIELYLTKKVKIRPKIDAKS